MYSYFLAVAVCDKSDRWEDGTPVDGMNQKMYARVKAKNITSVPGFNQKIMIQNMINQKMTTVFTMGHKL